MDPRGYQGLESERPSACTIIQIPNFDYHCGPSTAISWGRIYGVVRVCSGIFPLLTLTTPYTHPLAFARGSPMS